jgi:hypothetical protein
VQSGEYNEYWFDYSDSADVGVCSMYVGWKHSTIVPGWIDGGANSEDGV